MTRRLGAALPAALALCLGAAAALAGQGGEGPAGAALEVVGPFDYDWSVRTAAGEEVPLTSYRGEVLVVNFWATWCAPCVAELGSFARLEDRLEARGTDVRFVYVSPEDPEQVERFARRYGRQNGWPPDLVTEARRAPSSLGQLVLPTTFVVNREGDIVLRHRGASDWALPGVVDFLVALAGDASSFPPLDRR